MSWKLYEGDCFDYLPLIEDGSVDMILCDLPYGTTACKWDTPLPLDELWFEYKRVIKDNGAIVLTASQPFTTTLIYSNIEMFKYLWVWNKKLAGNGILAHIQPLKIHEDVLIFGNGKINYYPQMTKGELRKKLTNNLPISEINGGDGVKCCNETFNDDYYPNSILEFTIANMRTGRLHPTQKPVKLFEYLIKTYTNENELVLDNCAGSGTTGVACENTGRNSIMMEKEPEYCQIIKDRMATVQELQLEARKQKTLNEFNGQATLDMPAK